MALCQLLSFVQFFTGHGIKFEHTCVNQQFAMFGEKKHLPAFRGICNTVLTQTARVIGPEHGQTWGQAQKSRGEGIQKEGTEICLLPL